MRRYDRALAFAGRWATTGLTFLLALVFLLPLFFMVSVSGQTTQARTPGIQCGGHRHFILGTTRAVFKTFPFWEYAFNTFKIAAPATIGTLISSAFVAYGFACFTWRGQNVVFYIVLATMMIPQWLTVVPLYVIYSKIGWVGTYYPLWVPAFFGDPFSIFLLRQFFLTIPRELLASARVDGASHFRIFRSIVIPLSRPALKRCGLVRLSVFVDGLFFATCVLVQPEHIHSAVGAVQFLRPVLCELASVYGGLHTCAAAGVGLVLGHATHLH